MSAAAPPLNVIVDTDVGTDDLMAISFLLSRSDVQIEAFTVANGLAHVDAGAVNLLRLQAVIGANIPVYIGRSTPLQGDSHFPDAWRKKTDTLPGVNLPPAAGAPQAQSAVDFLTGRLASPANPVTILAIGPLTNLGQVFQQTPATVKAVRQMVIMGGAVGVPGNAPESSSHPVAEWNIYTDPYAAQLVFASGVNPVLVPLNATNDVPIHEPFVKEFKARSRTPLGTIVGEILDVYQVFIHQKTFFAWDPLAGVAVADPSVVSTTSMCIQVQQSGSAIGQTQQVTGQPANTQVSTSADAKNFKKTFLAAFEQ